MVEQGHQALAAQGDNDAAREEFVGRIKAACEHLQDGWSAVRVLSYLLVAEPGDRLSQVLRHLDADHVKGNLAEFVSEEGPINQAQIDLFKLLGAGHG